MSQAGKSYSAVLSTPYEMKPEALTNGTLTECKLEDRYVLVKIMAAGLNPVDWKIQSGYAPPLQPKHNVLGLDFAGIVEEVGDAVAKFERGDRVWGFANGITYASNGSFAKKVAIHELCVGKMPENMSFPQMGAVPCAGLTAYLCLERTKLQKGDSALVAGASGGVGTYSVPLVADRIGGTDKLFVTAGSEKSKKHLVDVHGVKEENVIMYRNKTFAQMVEEIKEKNGGRGPEACFDFVGKNMKRLCCEAVGIRGDVVSIVQENAEGKDSDFAEESIRLLSFASPLFNKSASLHCCFIYAPSFGDLKDVSWFQQAFDYVNARFADGRIPPPVITELKGITAESVYQGMQMLIKGGVQGKIVMVEDA